MPVVLFEAGEVARSGHRYGDRTGVEYEYPAGRYERWIQRGERFLYSAPRAGYIGCGIIGEIRRSGNHGRLVCQVLSVVYFDEPVPLKDLGGRYYEADPAYWKENVYFGQGVRPISESRFDAVLAAADVMMPRARTLAVPSYPNAATARRVEDISVAAALLVAQSRFNAPVTVMPRNNPGFDLLVGNEDSPIRYVEVKGTQSANPAFFMSDGEREFSIAHGDKYTLIVVTCVDIVTGTYEGVSVRDGALNGEGVQFRPSQWRGFLTCGPNWRH